MQVELEGADPQGDSTLGNPGSEFGSGRAGSARHSLDLGGHESLHSLVALLAGDFPRTCGTKPKQQGQNVTPQSEPSVWCVRGRSCAWGAFTLLSCLFCVSMRCRRSMRLEMPCSRLSMVWCCGSCPLKLFLRLRRASRTSCRSLVCPKHPS